MTSALLRGLLTPLVPAYQLGLALREWRLHSGRELIRRLRYPVVSVGSLAAGGAGKTPLTIALVEALTARGFHVDVLSRGYGRTGRQAMRVRPDGTADEFGDEPLLIAQSTDAPVYVGAERYEAGELAEAFVQDEAPLSRRPIVHLLDDGFQHRQLARDIDILLVNRLDWRDRLLPAGNLREALHAAGRADAIAIPADDPAFEQELRDWGWRGPVWRVRRAMTIPRVDGPVVAFCGIARPGQFFRGLEDGGLRISARRAFADHYRYKRSDLERVFNDARSAGAAALITTEKDRARMATLANAIPASMPFLTVRLRLELDEECVPWLVDRISARLTLVSL